MRKVIAGFLCAVLLIGTLSMDVMASDFHYRSTKSTDKRFSYEYGVFVGLDEKKSSRLKDYHRVVIDAEYFSKKSITKLKKQGHVVYTYLNIGSLENFRSDYDKYKKYTIGEYENWEEEQWVDVSQKPWQQRIKKLARTYHKKGVDGFFIDNCDVYYFAGGSKASKDKLFGGLCAILKDLRSTYHKPVIINGGDTFVSRCIARKYKLTKYFTGVNQECVYTSIDFDNNKLKKADKSTTQYYESYLKKVRKKGLDVYLTEYTKSSSMKKTIYKKCKKQGYCYYAADAIQLI